MKMDPEENDEGQIYEIDLRWMEKEFANHTGFNLTLKTYEGDSIGGRIVGVRNGQVLLIDSLGNRLMCDLGIISIYHISKILKKKTKAKSKSTKKTTKKEPVKKK